MELTAKAVNQGTQDQLLLAKQLQATGEAVSGLTRRQMRMEAGSDSPCSDLDEVNPFSPDPGPSANRSTFGRNRARYDNEPTHHSYLPEMSFFCV